MSPRSSAFRFEEFAQDIYREKRNAHRLPFILPALYGGEPVEEYEALFVLEAPSVPFTEKRWQLCYTSEDAIKIHRRIFLAWAYSGKQRYLFQSLFNTSSLDFYSRFYVTDVWKDAAFRDNVGSLKYQEYWLTKLEIELKQVRAKRVIFVGREAADAGWSLVRDNIGFRHRIPFPSQWISNAQFVTHVDTLAEELQQSPRSNLTSPAPADALRTGQHRDEALQQSFTRTSGGGRDALWREVFSAATPLKAAGILAVHPDAPARTARLMTEPTAARIVAMANAMYNPCRPEHLAYTGRAASEEAWGILLSRRDTPYMRAGTKWERLVRALDPIPEWAAERVRKMDIMAIGSVAAALIRGPYSRV